MSKKNLFDVIERHIITEKSSNSVESARQYSFYVSKQASKPVIAKAVEQIFGVKVIGVNIINTHGKIKVFRGIKGFKQDKKKALVTIEKGQTIDLSSAQI